MNIEAYLDRIGFQGPLKADLETLQALHRAHLLAIPYENFDVQFGVALTPDPAAAYDKIVNRRRGGWCYEQNGLFGWALGELGFKVTRLAGGPQSEEGERLTGNHLVLRVDLDDEIWMADVGFGDGPFEPYRLTAGDFSTRQFNFTVDDLGEGWWRLNNHPHGMARFYEFHIDAPAESLLSARCDWLRTDPGSPFVLNAVALRHTPKGQTKLVGRLQLTQTEGEPQKHLIADPDEYLAILKADFGLDLPQAADLWPKICARHEVLFAEQAG